MGPLFARPIGSRRSVHDRGGQIEHCGGRVWRFPAFAKRLLRVCIMMGSGAACQVLEQGKYTTMRREKANLV